MTEIETPIEEGRLGDALALANENDIELLFDKGSDILCSDKKYSEAEKIFRKIIELDENHFAAYIDLGYLLTELWEFKKAKEEFKKAEEICKKIIEGDPNNTEAHYYYGMALYGLKESRKAKIEFERAIEVDGEDLCANAYFYLGILLTELWEYEDAKDAFERAIELGNEDAYLSFGLLLLNFGELEKAEVNFKKAEEIYKSRVNSNPSPQNHYNLGLVLFSLKKYDKATKEFEESIRRNPEYIDAYFMFGLVLDELGKYEEAKKKYNEVIAKNPRYANAYANCSRILYNLKRYEEAKKNAEKAQKIYEEILNLYPKFVDNLCALELVYFTSKQYDKAEDVFRELVKIAPNHVDAHNTLGYVLSEKKRYIEAEREYEKALETNPKFYSALHNLGELYYELYKQKKKEEYLYKAENKYREALQINPNLSDTHNGLGLVLIEDGSLNDAIDEFKSALKISGYFDIHNNLGCAYAEMSKNSLLFFKWIHDAKNEFLKAIESYPTYVEAHKNLRSVNKLSTNEYIIFLLRLFVVIGVLVASLSLLDPLLTLTIVGIVTIISFFILDFSKIEIKGLKLGVVELEFKYEKPRSVAFSYSLRK